VKQSPPSKDIDTERERAGLQKPLPGTMIPNGCTKGLVRLLRKGLLNSGADTRSEDRKTPVHGDKNSSRKRSTKKGKKSQNLGIR